ncbi:heterokaryon incompatibility protein-domain-containing protein [Paraphoma chrysanthemicola]|uniref:Heterokaryon incompatibility protein-domain-containing protein n=1 Tax=Paraphoma chrysanthemicola TaxID=798071 RepID=A0A8K0R678_9PLEO|nr:heterokaryon incompatibility protein-domain-containing protein [Paraphoma chrysanthemicola]
MNEDALLSLNYPNQEDLFRHRPLDLDPSVHSIRLIRIHAAEDEVEPIKCDIKTATINDEYICLSYVWGEPTPGHWILVNEKRLYVRQNVWDFLNTACRMEEFRDTWIWIDAICIDQGNVRERGHQVQQMGRIFSNATRVVAWLGLDLDVSRLFKWIKDRNYTFPGGVIAFTKSPYWRRAWITQEFALAREVLYMASDMTAHADWLDAHLKKVKSVTGTHFMDTVRYIRNHSEKKSLVQLLDRLLYKECHEPRDRIFSMLALCWDGSGVEVNYSDSDDECASAIVKSCRHSFCLCSFLLITVALDLHVPQGIRSSWVQSAGQVECAELRVPVHCSIGADFIQIFISTIAKGFQNISHSLDDATSQWEIRDCMHDIRKFSSGLYLWKDQENKKMYTRAMGYIRLSTVCRKRPGQFLIINIDLASGQSRVYQLVACDIPIVSLEEGFCIWSIESFEWILSIDLPLDAHHCKLRISFTQLRQIACHIGRPLTHRRYPNLASHDCCSRVNAIQDFSETIHGAGEIDESRLQLCTGVPGIYSC